MKKKITIILFFLSFFLCSFTIVSAVGTTNIEYWDEISIMNDNFVVGVSSTTNLHSYSGNRGLEKITPISIQDTDNESVKVFIAQASYTFSVVFWTECGPNEAVALTEQNLLRQWLKLTTTPGGFYHEWTTTTYNIRYNYYNVAMKSTGTGFKGQVYFDANLIDLTPETLDFGNTVVNINSKQFISELSSIMLVDSHVETHADYANIVNTNEDAEIVVHDISPDLNKVEGVCDEAGDIIASHFNNVDLGVKRGLKSTSTFQQGATTIPRGSVDDIQSKGVYIALVPDVKKINQEIIIRSQEITVDTKTQLFSSARIIEMSSVKQDTYVVPIGVEVTNYAISLDLKANFMLYSTCEINSLIEDDKPALGIPDSDLEDYYWDDFLEGQTGADVSYQMESDIEIAINRFLGNYGTIIIIVGISLLAIVGIGVFVYVKYFSPVSMAKSMRPMQ